VQDCFAYKNKRCIALKVIKCDGCNFYKTKEQYELDKQKALDRILSRDQETQKYISEKYYGGKLGCHC
jgi:hypothetical protein